LNLEPIQTLTKDQKVLYFAALLVTSLVINAAFYALGVKPATERSNTLKADVELAHKSVAKINDGIARHEAYEAGRQRVAEFKALLPTASEYTDVLRRTYALAKKRNVFESSISVSSQTKFSDMVMLSFNLPVSGNYRDVRRFINDVETSDLFLNIGNLSLSKGGKGNVISLKIGLSTYVRR